MGTNSPSQERQNTERLVLVVTLLLIFLMAARTPVDTDLWWHLRAGEETLQTGLPVMTDHYSYTRAGQAWSNHSWLAQVILAGIFRLGGFLGLGFLVASTITATLALVYLQMPGPGLLRAFILALVAAVSAPVWMPRPQIFSLLCFALTGYLLYLYVQQRIDRLWLMPLLFALWANLHGGYPLGLALLVATIAGMVFDRIRGVASCSWAEIRRLAAWTGVALLSLLANPGGIRAWLIPFQTVSVGALQDFIQEWASPDFHQLSQQPFLWLLMVCLLALGLSARPIAAGDLFALIGFTGLALMARRNFGPFALAAGPILARLIWPSLIPDRFRLPAAWQERWKQVSSSPGRDLPGLRRLKHGINLALVALIAFTGCVKLYAVTHPVFIASVVDQGYPVGAVSWMKEHQPAGRLFNSYNWGGYLTWALPEYPVFVDGRTDLFGDQIIGEWMTVVQAGEGWEAILDRWDVHLILIESDRPLVPLLADAGWVLHDAEEGYVLYGR